MGFWDGIRKTIFKKCFRMVSHFSKRQDTVEKQFFFKQSKVS